MCVLAVLVLGAVGLSQLPIDLMPDITFPVVAVITSYPGASPAQVEEFVTKPIEEAAAVVEDLESISSISQQDVSMVIIEFDWGKDMNWAAFDTREKIDPVIEALPSDVHRPLIMKIDPSTMSPVMTLNVTGLSDMSQLRELAEDVVKPEVEKLGGVAAADIFGGLQREIHVEVDWEKLGARGVSVGQVESALQRENRNIPAGFTTEGQREYTIRVIGEFDVVDQIRNVVVGVRGGHPVYLRDVATITDTFQEVRSYARLNGSPAVGISIQKEAGGNTVAVADAVREELEAVQSKLPEGVEVSITSEEASFIRAALENLYGVGIEGALLAMVIIFLFLATFRGTIIAALSIPLSALVTFVFMYFADMTLNIITMGGLVLAIGRIVDDSVVVLENIHRHIENGEPVLDAAINGTEELWAAIAAITFTTMVMFFPLMFVGGMISVLFSPMSLVVMLGLLASLIVSVTIVPLLSERMFSRGAHRGTHSVEESRQRGIKRALAGWGRAFDRLAAWYRRAINWSLGHRGVIVFIALGVFIGSLMMVPLVGLEFFPSIESDELTITMETPIGSSVEYTNERALQIEEIIDQVEEKLHYTVSLGSAEGGGIFGGGSSGTRTATFVLKVVPRTERERSVSEIEQELREKFALLPGIETRFEQRAGPSMGAALELKIIGDDLTTLAQLSDDVIERVSDVPGLTDVQVDWEAANPEYHVHVDRDEAGRLGLTVSDIGSSIQTQVRGTEQLTKFRTGDSEYDIKVRAREADRDWIEQVRNTKLITPSGTVVPLSSVASVVSAVGPTRISREERERTVTISGDTLGRPLSEVVSDLDQEMQQMSLPEGYRYEFGGSEEDRAEAFGGMFQALILGMLLIYMILAAQFESFVHPLIIMLAIPLELVGVLGALLLTGTPLGIMAMLGVLMLTGIVVSNSILMVQMVNLLRHRGLAIHEALVEGGAVRLRPILMTAMATVLAMLPLALAVRTGSEMWKPLGIAAIGGLMTSTFLTLFVIPVAYSLAESAIAWFHRRFGHHDRQATDQ
jgi:HAE1 family hydrophobic/amphiphilic exporter-1